MKKSIIKNYIYNSSYQILQILTPLITVPYLARVLGAENLGIYSFTLSISTYFILFGTLGISLYGYREIAFFQDDKEKYTKIFLEIFLLKLLLMSISMIVFYLLLIHNVNEYSLYYKIMLLELLCVVIDISWFFQGLEEFKKIVIRNIIIKIIKIACIFIFVKTQDDLILYFLIAAIGSLIGVLSLWLYMPKFLTKIDIKTLNLKRHLKPTIALFIPQIAVQVYTALDKSMIGFIIADKSEVGYYDQAQKILKIMLIVIQSLPAVMLPRVASLFAQNQTEKIKEYTNKSFLFVCLLAFPMIFGLLCIVEEFVPLFFGEGFEKVTILLCVLSFIILLSGLGSVIGSQYLLPTKRQKELSIAVTIGACVDAVMNLLFIPSYGALGAAIGTLCAEICVLSILFYIVRDELKCLKMLKNAKSYLFAALIMYVCCVWIGNFIDNKLLSVIIKIVFGTSVYGLILFLLKDEFVLVIVKKIKVQIYKKSNGE